MVSNLIKYRFMFFFILIMTVSYEEPLVVDKNIFLELPSDYKYVKLDPFATYQILLRKDKLQPNHYYRILFSYHGYDAVNVELSFQSNQIQKRQARLRTLKDHELLFFNTDMNSNIIDHNQSIIELDQNKYYSILLKVNRIAHSYSEERKRASFNANIEIEGGEASSQFTFIISKYFRFGIFTIMLILGFFLLAFYLIFQKTILRELISIPSQISKFE